MIFKYIILNNTINYNLENVIGITKNLETINKIMTKTTKMPGKYYYTYI